MAMKQQYILAAGIVLLGALSGLIGKGSTVHQTALMLMVVGYLIAGTLSVFLLALLERRRPKGRKPPFRLITASFVVGLIASWMVGDWIHDAEIASAKAYVTTAAPALDAYRNEHGHYPDSLARLDLLELPVLFRKPWGYKSDGQQYTFSYPDSQKMMAAQYFDSSQHRWISTE